jgi:hypothetical protein
MTKDETPDRPKKPYEKPEISRVELHPEEAVLGACKNGGHSGPGQPRCSFPSACVSMGS